MTVKILSDEEVEALEKHIKGIVAVYPDNMTGRGMLRLIATIKAKDKEIEGLEKQLSNMTNEFNEAMDRLIDLEGI